MSVVALAMNGFLAVLLIAALAFGWRLERRLKALRDSHEGFAKAVKDLDTAAARAEQGLADLRAATDEAAETLAVRIERAQALAAQLDERINRPLAAPSASTPRPTRASEPPPTVAPAPGERRLSAADFERLLDREDRVERAARGEPLPRPISRPTPPAETPRSRARIDDDLFDGPADGPRPGSNPRAPRR
ncbi:DUF6468 domain-containing protein [uncultured Caulobacter sp.]|uniref:DUF6468 domain-containing protein n=1 Tax=uncultured Caulobacter sp. TaxID=158749 RepID=UPI0026329DEB|nr:DUF6468 domain-containing protein [uncultured Caulobacter sp.]